MSVINRRIKTLEKGKTSHDVSVRYTVTNPSRVNTCQSFLFLFSANKKEVSSYEEH